MKILTEIISNISKPSQKNHVLQRLVIPQVETHDHTLINVTMYPPTIPSLLLNVCRFPQFRDILLERVVLFYALSSANGQRFISEDYGTYVVYFNFSVTLSIHALNSINDVKSKLRNDNNHNVSTRFDYSQFRVVIFFRHSSRRHDADDVNCQTSTASQSVTIQRRESETEN